MGLHDGHRARKKEQFRLHGLDSFADHEVLELALYYAVMGLICCVTIVGIPLGLQSFKMAKLALMPFGAAVQ